MQQAVMLQPRATTGANRLNAIRLRHCTEEAVAKETSIAVDAATKAGPMCTLIEQVQQDAAAAMDTISVLHPYVKGVPALGSLAGSFLPGKLPEAALKVHREEARKKVLKMRRERQQLRRDRRTAEEKAAIKTKANEMKQLKPDRMTAEEKAALNTKAKEMKQLRLDRMAVKEKAALNTKANEMKQLRLDRMAVEEQAAITHDKGER
jgi:hypothetical protein